MKLTVSPSGDMTSGLITSDWETWDQWPLTFPGLPWRPQPPNKWVDSHHLRIICRKHFIEGLKNWDSFKVEQDIISSLNLRKPVQTFKSSVYRPNLFYEVRFNDLLPGSGFDDLVKFAQTCLKIDVSLPKRERQVLTNPFCYLITLRSGKNFWKSLVLFLLRYQNVPNCAPYHGLTHKRFDMKMLIVFNIYGLILNFLKNCPYDSYHRFSWTIIFMR